MRLKGIKTERQREFYQTGTKLSSFDGIFNDITNICEQFLLLPQEETILIAEEPGNKHLKTLKQENLLRDNRLPTNY